MKDVSWLVGVCVLIVIGFAQSANAANVWHTSRITRIYPTGGGNSFVLRFETPSPTCANANSYFYARVGYNGLTVEGAKTLLAVAMLGMSLDKPVGVLFDNASNYCDVNTLFVDR